MRATWQTRTCRSTNKTVAARLSFVIELGVAKHLPWRVRLFARSFLVILQAI